MSLYPVFKIGFWNAWILQVLFFLTMFIPDLFLDKEARNKTKRMSTLAPFEKTEKLIALAAHVFIMPLVLVYSIFLPLKIGTAWLYAGLLIFTAALVISVASIFNAASASTKEPVTRGVYRFSRHPIYLSGFLMYISIAICCASWLVLVFAFLWIISWLVVAPVEERLLVEKYGDTYREYMNRTPRWMGFPKAEMTKKAS
ncbi:methyltransferase family protein [Acidobacteriota bacterium]